MSLIYPKTAFARFGRPSIAVHDAKGRRIWYVVACNPLTGEVVDRFTGEGLSGGLAQWAYRRISGPISNVFWCRYQIHSLPSIVTRHYFAPAPLTITRVEGP